MIIQPWTPTTYWLMLAFTMIPILCYLFVLSRMFKNEKVFLIALLSAILLLSQFFFIFFILFDSQLYHAYYNDEGN